jgi:hypothetical protein
MMLLRVWPQISTVSLAAQTLTCLGRLIDGFIHRPRLLRVRQISRHFKLPALWQSGKGLWGYSQAVVFPFIDRPPKPGLLFYQN